MFTTSLKYKMWNALSCDLLFWLLCCSLYDRPTPLIMQKTVFFKMLCALPLCGTLWFMIYPFVFVSLSLSFLLGVCLSHSF